MSATRKGARRRAVDDSILQYPSYRGQGCSLTLSMAAIRGCASGGRVGRGRSLNNWTPFFPQCTDAAKYLRDHERLCCL